MKKRFLSCSEVFYSAALSKRASISLLTHGAFKKLFCSCFSPLCLQDSNNITHMLQNVRVGGDSHSHTPSHSHTHSQHAAVHTVNKTFQRPTKDSTQALVKSCTFDLLTQCRVSCLHHADEWRARIMQTFGLLFCFCFFFVFSTCFINATQLTEAPALLPVSLYVIDANTETWLFLSRFLCC